MASMSLKVEFGFRFEISNLNYHYIYMHISSYGNFNGLGGCGDLQMTSKVTFDLKFELTGLIDLSYSYDSGGWSF